MRTFSHQLQTWEYYPRIYYFNNRLQDFIPRFQHVIGPYTKCLHHAEKVVKELVDLKTLFEYPPEIKIVDEDDLPQELFVVANVSLESFRDRTGKNPYKVRPPIEREQSKLKILICHAAVDGYGSEVLQKVRSRLEWICRSEENKSSVLLIACATKTSQTEDKFNSFCVNLKQMISKDFGELSDNNLLLASSDIATAISEALEYKIVKGFGAVQLFLKGFTTSYIQRTGYTMPRLDDISFVSTEVQLFLDKIYYIGQEMGDDKQLLVEKLSRGIKCRLVEYLSERNKLQPRLCNSVLIDRHFEQVLIKAVSDDMRDSVLQYKKEHDKLEKIYKNEAIKFEHHQAQAKALSEKIIEAVKSKVTEAEQEVGKLARTLSRLTCELNGYLKKSKIFNGTEVDWPESSVILASQTFTESAVTEEADGTVPYSPDSRKTSGIATSATVTLNTKQSQEIRRYILEQKGVCGAGTVYGDFEIHVLKSEYINTVKNAVIDFSRRSNIYFPFVVKEVEREAKPLLLVMFEAGDPISCTIGQRSGTLGGFVHGSDGKLYGLTCAHVVTLNGLQTDVFIKGNIAFARTNQNLVARPEHNDGQMTDIAALQVYANHEQNCMKRLQDERGILREGRLFDSDPATLVESYVFKYGAASSLTKGLVCSVDYNLFTTPNGCVVLIDKFDEDDPPFAEPGDSGSMICMPNISDSLRIEAVGLLSSGGLQLRECAVTPYSLAFLLTSELQKLSSIAGINFTFPTGDE